MFVAHPTHETEAYVDIDLLICNKYFLFIEFNNLNYF
jgi:hypothetical protein